MATKTLTRDVTCKKCGGIIPAGTECGVTSGMRYYHDLGCPSKTSAPVEAKPAAPAPMVAPRRQSYPALDSYEQECEDEGIRMRGRYGRPLSY